MGSLGAGRRSRPDGHDDRSTAQTYGDAASTHVRVGSTAIAEIALRTEFRHLLGSDAADWRARGEPSRSGLSALFATTPLAPMVPRQPHETRSIGTTARAMRRPAARPDSAVSSGWWPRSTPGRVSRPTATACGGRSSARADAFPADGRAGIRFSAGRGRRRFVGPGTSANRVGVCGWLDLRVLLGGRGATCRYRYPHMGLALGQPHPTGQRQGGWVRQAVEDAAYPMRERSRARPGWPRRLELVAEAWGSQAPPRSNSLPRRPSRQGEAGALLRTVLIEEVDRHGGTRLLGRNDHTEICR